MKRDERSLLSLIVRPIDTAYRFKKILRVLRSNGRGIHKRIDENRELLEQLQQQAPQLLNNAPWIERWLQSQDEFLTALEAYAGIENPVRSTRFPRPWPGRKVGAHKP